MWKVEYKKFYEDDGWLDFVRYFDTKEEAYEFFNENPFWHSKPVFVKMTLKEKLLAPRY